MAGGGQPAAYPAYPGAADPRPPRPPLTKRMRRGHWIVIDCAVGLFVAVCDTAISGRFFPEGQVRLPIALLFLVAVFLPVALRRRAPVFAFGALVILGVLLAGLSPSVPAAVYLAAAYVLYTVTVEARRRTGAAALALLLAVMIGLGVAAPHTVGVVGNVRASGADTGVYVPVALASVIAWMTGYSVRQRRRYVVTLQHQAASSAVAEERLRIARELHDVVAHSMSVIAVQAGYGQYVIDASPDGAREALGAIQATSRDALEEMRRMLGVLRQQDTDRGPAGASAPVRGGPGLGATPGTAPGASPASAGHPAPLTPAPGLAGLDRLIARTRGAGVHVALEVAGRARPAPAGVDLSAYRIIQEALTNVVRHAGSGAACQVGVTYTDSDLVIQVTDDGGRAGGTGPAGPQLAGPVPGGTVSARTGLEGLAAAGAGHGIIGMRERVNLCGGSFQAGPRPEGGFQVLAALPLPLPAMGYQADGAGGAPADEGPTSTGPTGTGPTDTGPAEDIVQMGRPGESPVDTGASGTGASSVAVGRHWGRG